MFFFAALSHKNIQPKRKIDHEEEEEDNVKNEKKKKTKYIIVFRKF